MVTQIQSQYIPIHVLSPKLWLVKFKWACGWHAQVVYIYHLLLFVIFSCIVLLLDLFCARSWAIKIVIYRARSWQHSRKYSNRCIMSMLLVIEMMLLESDIQDISHVITWYLSIYFAKYWKMPTYLITYRTRLKTIQEHAAINMHWHKFNIQDPNWQLLHQVSKSKFLLSSYSTSYTEQKTKFKVSNSTIQPAR